MSSEKIQERSGSSINSTKFQELESEVTLFNDLKTNSTNARTDLIEKTTFIFPTIYIKPEFSKIYKMSVMIQPLADCDLYDFIMSDRSPISKSSSEEKSRSIDIENCAILYQIAKWIKFHV